jgi:YesN/AraC family two-component response regulator
MFFEMGYNLKEVFDKWGEYENCDILSEFMKMDTLQDVINWVGELFQKISDLMEEKRRIKDYTVIDEIIHYIDNNYNEDIYLSNISDKYGMSDSYLSKAFKTRTGTKFLDT